MKGKKMCRKFNPNVEDNPLSVKGARKQAKQLAKRASNKILKKREKRAVDAAFGDFENKPFSNMDLEFEE